jgi:hypothetical protein
LQPGETPQETLAEGDLFEWQLRRERFELELTCTPSFILLLNDNAGNGNSDSRVYGNSWRHIVYECFRQVYRRAITNDPNSPLFCPLFSDSPNDISEEERLEAVSFFADAINRIAPWGRPFDRLTVSVKTNSGNKRDALIMIAQLLNLKFVYDQQEKLIKFVKPEESQPIELEGGYIAEHFQKIRQKPDDFDGFYVLNVSNVSGDPPPPSIVDRDIKNEMNSVVRNRISLMDNDIEYKIWGYARQYIMSGEVVKLDGVVYYVKEINYEFETLESLMSFTAVCVRV